MGLVCPSSLLCVCCRYAPALSTGWLAGSRAHPLPPGLLSEPHVQAGPPPSSSAFSQKSEQNRFQRGSAVGLSVRERWEYRGKLVFPWCVHTCGRLGTGRKRVCVASRSKQHAYC